MPQAIPGLLTEAAKHWFGTSLLLGAFWAKFKQVLDFLLPPKYFQRLEDYIPGNPSYNIWLTFD